MLGALCLSALPTVAATPNAYIQHNLVADTPGLADVTDPTLINPWGIAVSATSPFWVSDGGTGFATVYSTSATATITQVTAVKVTIPHGAGSTDTFGVVTGELSNTSTAFLLANGNKASFIFATEDGTVSAWNTGTVAQVKIDNSANGASYKGLALGGTSTAPQLYVANFSGAAVEVYDGNFAPVTLPAGAFTDSQIPAGYGPFNIVNINGKLYVAYAKQGTKKRFDAAGPGNGYVDIFDMSGTLVTRLVAGGTLNSPWGMAIAPANFGALSNMLLVGNFGNGRINAFDPATGASQGAVLDPSGSPITISGLWALQVGNGKSGGDTNAVYFAAGTGGELHGLFGSLQAAPVSAPAGPVLNSASFQTGMAQYTWVSIFGANLSSTTRSWATADFVNGALPKSLDKVSVTIDGKPAYVSYISPTQINALVAADPTLGPVQITTSNQGLASNGFTATMTATAPAFFISKSNYVAGFKSDNKTIVGPVTLFANGASAPAKPGEIISIYGTGFGPASTPIPDGALITTAIPMTGVSVTIGGASASAAFAGLVGPGLYQFNVTVPSTLADGDAALSATVGGATTPTGPLVAVAH
ncbi:MAG TPA: TIGR03118 family protein [Bryobacteraceae bacterium]